MADTKMMMKGKIVISGPGNQIQIIPKVTSYYT